MCVLLNGLSKVFPSDTYSLQCRKLEIMFAKLGLED